MDYLKKISSFIFLILIYCSTLYLVYLYVYAVCAIQINNICSIPFEPSGSQLFLFIISLPVFYILILLSICYSWYYNISGTLTCIITSFWTSQISLLLIVDLIFHYRETSNQILYYGSLCISLLTLLYLLYKFYCQIVQLCIPKQI
jgi:hypothetical protein